MSQAGIAATAAALRAATSVVVLTGAGVSAESGIPTFREAATGLWSRFRPEELASPEAFRKWPERVWAWYAWRRSLVAAAEPNPAHVALAELERCLPGLVLITQNVDGLHQRAGSTRVVELHGNITRTKCSRDNRLVEHHPPADPLPPRCPDCGANLRPDVVWFGEMLPGRPLRESIEAASRCDVFLAVGTSGLVHPAASLPMLAHETGARVVVINPDDAVPLLALEGVTHLNGPAAVVLPALLAAVKAAAS